MHIFEKIHAYLINEIMLILCVQSLPHTHKHNYIHANAYVHVCMYAFKCKYIYIECVRMWVSINLLLFSMHTILIYSNKMKTI